MFFKGRGKGQDSVNEQRERGGNGDSEGDWSTSILRERTNK